MNAVELMDEINKLGVVELEQNLRQLQGQVAAIRKLIALAKARHRKRKKAPSGVAEPVAAGKT